MDKFRTLLNKIANFSTIAIDSYRLLKISNNITLEEFTDNSVMFDENGPYGTVNFLKKKINKSLEKLSDFANTIEIVKNNGFKNKQDMASAFKDAVEGFVFEFQNMSSLLNEIDPDPSSDTSIGKFIENEGDNLTPDQFIDFITNAYDAVDSAVVSMTGINMENMADVAADGSGGASEGERAFAEHGAVETAEEGIEGYSYSSSDSKKRDDYMFLKNLIQNAQQFEKDNPGKKHPLLESRRESIRKWYQNVKEDPEKWAALQEKQQSFYQNRKENKSPKYDELLNELFPYFQEYGIRLPEKLTYRAITSAADTLKQKISSDKSTKGRKVHHLLNDFEKASKIFMRTKENEASVTKYDAVLREGLKEGRVRDMLIKFQQDLSPSKLLLNTALIKKVEETLPQDKIEALKTVIKEANKNGDKLVAKQAGKELRDLIKSEFKAKHYGPIKNRVVPLRKKMFELYGGRAQEAGEVRKINPAKYAEASRLVQEARSVLQELGPQYNVLTKWLPQIIAGIEKEVMGELQNQTGQDISNDVGTFENEPEDSDRKTIFAPPNF